MKKVLTVVFALLTMTLFAQEKIYSPTFNSPTESATNQDIDVPTITKFNWIRIVDSATQYYILQFIPPMKHPYFSLEIIIFGESVLLMLQVIPQAGLHQELSKQCINLH